MGGRARAGDASGVVSDALLAAYHRLPPWSRTCVASVRGLYLRAWRYGPETDRLVSRALEREHWSPREWDEWRSARLTMVLRRAAEHVPYYRALWRDRRLAGDRPAIEALHSWPVLRKDSLRSDPAAFVADDRSRRDMFHDHTSGTTGKPLDIWLPRATVREWYALFEARARNWYGVSRRDRWAILGGQLVSPVAARQPPFWVWNAALHQLYMSSYHLAPDLVGHYVDALRRYRVRYILGYTSALHALARHILDAAASPPELAVVITNAEPVLPSQREAIERAFRCPLRETYGLAEGVTAASECEHGSLHLWPEAGVVEILSDSGGVVADGESGRIVCTSLLNPDMPLVRYDTGDRGAIAPSPTHCRCGRTLPIVAAIDGRADDVLITRDGRRVGRLDPVFKSALPILEAQIIQESLESVRVKFVPAAGWRPEHGEAIARRVRDRMGDVAVVLEPVASIPRSANGKFRAVINLLTLDERSKPGA